MIIIEIITISIYIIIPVVLVLIIKFFVHYSNQILFITLVFINIDNK